MRRDPLFSVVSQDYSYTKNNPINRIDPLGLDWGGPAHSFNLPCENKVDFECWIVPGPYGSDNPDDWAQGGFWDFGGWFDIRGYVHSEGGAFYGFVFDSSLFSMFVSGALITFGSYWGWGSIQVWMEGSTRFVDPGRDSNIVKWIDPKYGFGWRIDYPHGASVNNFWHKNFPHIQYWRFPPKR